VLSIERLPVDLPSLLMIYGEFLEELLVLLGPLDGGIIADLLRRHVGGCSALEGAVGLVDYLTKEAG